MQQGIVVSPLKRHRSGDDSSSSCEDVERDMVLKTSGMLYGATIMDHLTCCLSPLYRIPCSQT